MAGRSTYNGPKLKEAIENGMNAQQIMNQLSIKNKQTLEAHILRLMQEEKRFYEVPGMAGTRSRTPKINNKGELKLSANMLTNAGSNFAPGDAFVVEANENSITLRKI